MSFKRFDPQDVIASTDSSVSPCWSNDTPLLSSFFTSSVQVNGSTGDFYLSVFNENPVASTTSSVQFDIAYCNKSGSGGSQYNALVPGKTPTSTNYGQYRTLVLEDEYSDFIFGTGTNVVTGSDFWALSVERARYREKLFPGTFNLTLSSSLPLPGEFGRELKLTDDSKEILVNTFIGAQRAFQIISGSNGSSYNSSQGYSTSQGSYGLFLPDIGTILINPLATSESIGLTASRDINTDNFNQGTLYEAIKLGESFQLNAEESLSSNFVFVRLRNSEFNYSENPSFISSSNGELIYDEFINQPQVYITTVGMYNDANDLVATAKLSRPLLKDFTKEALIRVKLDF